MLFRLFSYITVGGYMKIERLSLGQFLLFFNASYLKDITLNKENLIQLVKELLAKFQNLLLLNGFYKVKVYVHRRIGIFLHILQMEEFEYGESVDFRIVVYLDEKIYFKTRDYFILPKDVSVYFDDTYFYCDVDDISDIMSVIEFGSFVYGRELDMVRKKWQKI